LDSKLGELKELAGCSSLDENIFSLSLDSKLSATMRFFLFRSESDPTRFKLDWFQSELGPAHFRPSKGKFHGLITQREYFSAFVSRKLSSGIVHRVLMFLPRTSQCYRGESNLSFSVFRHAYDAYPLRPAQFPLQLSFPL
jgi:hypothetical protein